MRRRGRWRGDVGAAGSGSEATSDALEANAVDAEVEHRPSGGSTDADTYRSHTQRLLAEASPEEVETAMAKAIGSATVEDFRRWGQLELDLLLQSGLRPDHCLVDVGCGSGRLTSRLVESGHTGPYTGTDLSPELLAFARRSVARDDWRFELVDGVEIPVDDGVADMVCFFSVLTHLRHEDSYLYLEEARRVLVPGGKIVFTYLEFNQKDHGEIFQATVDARRSGGEQPVNQFMSADAVLLWARLLGLYVEAVYPGSVNYVNLTESTHYEPGERVGTLGQSACVLVKPLA